MSKHKKNKNKKKKFVRSSETTQFNQATPVSKVVTVISEVQKISNRGLKKDLLKVSFVTILMLMIISGGYMIKTSTNWYNQTAESIYNWLQLG